jgi:hypothetical protein
MADLCSRFCGIERSWREGDSGKGHVYDERKEDENADEEEEDEEEEDGMG